MTANDRAYRLRSRLSHIDKSGYLFVLPALVFYVVFMAVPTIGTVVISLLDWTGVNFSSATWTGLDNYAEMLSDEVFREALVHNIVFIAFGTTATVALGLFLAVLLEQELPGSKVFRGIFFIPAVTSLVVVGLVFSLILSPDLGLVNPLLRSLGLGEFARAWLGDPQTALPTVIAADVWRNFGLAMFIFVAGLKGIDQELYEAAIVDGANRWQLFWRITMPMLRPVTVVVILLVSINSLKLFDLVYIMTNGGPNHASEVLSTWTYFQGFSINRFGYASAISVVLLVFTIVLGIVQIRAGRRS